MLVSLRIGRVSVVCLMFVLVCPARVAEGGQIVLWECATDSGCVATHATPPGYIHGLGFMIAGGAVGDFNNDGWEDLYIVSGGTAPDRLYINQSGSFVNQSTAWGITSAHMGAGVAVGDYNNDGWLDIFVASYGPTGGPMSIGQHRLLRNNAGTGFTNVAVAAGVNWSDTTINAFGAAFGDYDLDGDLDLYITGWRTGASSAGGNRLFRNNGNGTFTDVTLAAGLHESTLHGFAVRFVDMNGDRYPEILVAGDFYSSRYYVNNTDGTFSNQTAASGAGLDCNGMGTTIGDFDNDGDQDWYVTNIYRGDTMPSAPCGNRLYLNAGGNLFDEVAEAAGVIDGRWGWGTVAVDLDQDGRLDIVADNGYSDSDLGPMQWEDQPKRVYQNNGDLTFTDVAQSAGYTRTGQGRGVVNFDFDNDGDQDIGVFSFAEPFELYRNDSINAGNWLRVRLNTSAVTGLAPNGFGTRLLARTGAFWQTRYVDGGSNYLSQSELSAHFGLGGATFVDELRIEWADGDVLVEENVAAGQTLVVSALLRGDANCDGAVSVADIGPFVTALTDSTGYTALFPDCDVRHADVNSDQRVTVSDIGVFVSLLVGN
ncbi:MAG: FG-GAP-like repeat-containing protein [Phycisphaerae bacterium]